MAADMISIRYTAPRDLELEGSGLELESIRNTVAQISLTPGSAVRMLAQPLVDPSPYQKALQMLRLRIDDGLLHVLVLGNHLVVTGSAFAFEAFASALHAVASAPPGTHNHLEYHDGHPRIDPRSLPLVVSHRR